MNRREFMKVIAVVAAGITIPGGPQLAAPIRVIDNASSAFKQVGIVAGGQIRAGQAVYIVDDGRAYAAK